MLGPEPDDSNKIHLLIVEDEEPTRHALSMVIERAGARVSQVSNGQDALDFILANLGGPDQVDFLVFDIFMPRMNGTALLDALAERNIHLPGVALSGAGDDALRKELLDRGYCEFLEKPFDRDQSLLTISTMLRDLNEDI